MRGLDTGRPGTLKLNLTYFEFETGRAAFLKDLRTLLRAKNVFVAVGGWGLTMRQLTERRALVDAKKAVWPFAAVPSRLLHVL